MAKGGLGSGLDFLYEDNAEELQMRKTVPLCLLEPWEDQPRHDFAEEELEDLAASIRTYGLLQPILVRPIGDRYQIIAGERRWRAARLAELTEVPVVIRDLDDKEALSVALVENLQRTDLNPVEEARGYRAMMDSFGMTQQEVADKLQISRAQVANTLRLLNLSPPVLEMLEHGELSAGQGRALLAFADPEEQQARAQEAAAGKWTVRDLERLAKKPKKTITQKVETPSYYHEAELGLTEHFGRKVTVRAGKKKGTVTLEFYDQDDLRALLEQITGENEEGIFHD